MTTAFEFAAGLHHGVESRKYHALDALNSSSLPALAQSGAHFKALKENPFEPTPAMRLGSAVHSMTLEDGLVTGSVLRSPAASRASKAHKDFEAANPGKIILLEDEFAAAVSMMVSIENHELANAFLSEGVSEVTALWETENGIKCKARADYWRESIGVIVDLKTSRDASKEAFERTVLDRRYHWQSAWYLDGFSKATNRELRTFVHIVVENTPPYAVACYALDEAALDKAREDIQKLLARYSDCIHSGDFKGYPKDLQMISLPHYGFAKELVL